MRNVANHVRLTIYTLSGWVICGVTIGFGRQLMSMEATLLAHAVIAPATFGFLTWHYFRRVPRASATITAFSMVGMVIGLDALVVAPFFERSYAMFRSVIGTWVPFASILVTSYVVGRAAASQQGIAGGREDRDN